MRRTFLFCVFLTAFILRAQDKHSEIQLGSTYSIEELQTAVSKSNWCGYYHETENFQLLFDDGAIVFLKNKAGHLASPNSVSPSSSCYQAEITSSDNIYVITSEGWIIVPKSSEEIKKTKTN
tara:strand:+ start:549 stop:914 length:366 start_codon:yes stop_codon:yes gene_type:complete